MNYVELNHVSWIECKYIKYTCIHVFTLEYPELSYLYIIKIIIFFISSGCRGNSRFIQKTLVNGDF